MSVALVHQKSVYPASQHPPHTWKLSMNDLVMLPINIRWLSFHENDKNDNEFMSPEKLEKALSEVLDLYPLLAGRLEKLPLGELQIEYNQENLQGCLFTLATANFTLESLKNSNFSRNSIPDTLKAGTSHATLETPNFSVQMTRLACGSVVMGYALSHKVGDGYSAQTFVEKWSRICRGIEVEKPLLDRSSLTPTSAPLVGDHPEYKLCDPSSPLAPQIGTPETVRLVVTFGAESVVLLKTVAHIGLDAGRWVSTNDCVAVLLWRAIARARELKAGDATVCKIPVNGRKKWADMWQYFGNFVTYARVLWDAGALLNTSLSHATLHLHDSVELMNSARVQSSLNWIHRVPDKSWIQDNFNFFPGNDIVISSWQQFPMYTIDFGWGPPIKAVLHAPGRGGIFVILPRKEKDGLEVALSVISTDVAKMMADTELTQFATIKIE